MHPDWTSPESRCQGERILCTAPQPAVSCPLPLPPRVPTLPYPSRRRGNLILSQSRSTDFKAWEFTGNRGGNGAGIWDLDRVPLTSMASASGRPVRGPRPRDITSQLGRRPPQEPAPQLRVSLSASCDRPDASRTPRPRVSSDTTAPGRQRESAGRGLVHPFLEPLGAPCTRAAVASDASPRSPSPSPSCAMPA